MGREVIQLYLSHHGRLNYKKFIRAIFLLWVFCIATTFVPVLLFLPESQLITIGDKHFSAENVIYIFGAIVWIYGTTTLLVKRLHDLNRSGFPAYLVWVLFGINLLVGPIGIDDYSSAKTAMDYVYFCILFVIPCLIGAYLSLTMINQVSKDPNRYGPPS